MLSLLLEYYHNICLVLYINVSERKSNFVLTSCIKLLLKLLYKCQSSFTYEYIIHMKLLKVLNAKYVSSKKGIQPSMIQRIVLPTLIYSAKKINIYFSYTYVCLKFLTLIKKSCLDLLCQRIIIISFSVFHLFTLICSTGF